MVKAGGAPGRSSVRGPETTIVSTAPNSFPCPSCGRQIAAAGMPGAPVRCPVCAQVVKVPIAAPPTHPAASQVPPHSPQKKTNGLAIAALLCGLVGIITSCFPIIGLVGVILGIVALVQLRDEPERFRGKGMAITGIFAGAVSLILSFVLYSAIGPWISRSACYENLIVVREGMLRYAVANDSAYPPDFETAIQSGDVSIDDFFCAGGDWVSEDPYECYQYIEGQTTDDDPDNVLIYEKPKCHEGGSSVLFLDGRIEFIEPYARVEELVADTWARLADKPTGE